MQGWSNAGHSEVSYSTAVKSWKSENPKLFFYQWFQSNLIQTWGVFLFQPPTIEIWLTQWYIQIPQGHQKPPQKSQSYEATQNEVAQMGHFRLRNIHGNP